MSPNSNVLDVAQRLGARLKRITALEHAGPCPKCGGRDRFSVNTARGVFNCRGCGVGGDAIELTRHVLGCGFNEALDFVGDERAGQVLPAATTIPAKGGMDQARELDEVEDNAQRTGDAVALFRESIDPRNTPGEVYFASRRLKIGDLASRVLRWNERIGAVIALFRNIETGKPQAISRIFLDAAAHKRERRFLGPVGGAAVMLDPFDEVTGGLHIGEGIETCQAARQLGLRPTWALGSAGAIASFPVLAGIETLTILAEHDDASARATEACGSRWHAAGREVLVTKPFRGKDLNDVLRGAAA